MKGNHRYIVFIRKAIIDGKEKIQTFLSDGKMIFTEIDHNKTFEEIVVDIENRFKRGEFDEESVY